MYRLIDDGHTVQTGEIVDVILRGKRIKESKVFFNVPDSFRFNHPSVEFISADKRTTISINLNRTDKGYAATLYEYGRIFGCNLNRIKNRQGRWGLTVWIEPTTEKAAV